jgi:hypothetical protein
LRYVEPFIREDLVTFLECDSGTTSEALADLILGFITNHLDPSKLHGQAYDGASNMSGKTNGTLLGYLPYTLLLCIHILLLTL